MMGDRDFRTVIKNAIESVGKELDYKIDLENVNKIHHRQPVILNEKDINNYLNLQIDGSNFLKEATKPKLLKLRFTKKGEGFNLLSDLYKV